MTSQDVLALLKKNHGIELKSASSTLEEIVARQFVERLAEQRGITLPKGDIFSEQAVKAAKARGRRAQQEGHAAPPAAEAGRADAAAAATDQDVTAGRAGRGSPCTSSRRSPSRRTRAPVEAAPDASRGRSATRLTRTRCRKPRSLSRGASRRDAVGAGAGSACGRAAHEARTPSGADVRSRASRGAAACARARPLRAAQHSPARRGTGQGATGTTARARAAPARQPAGATRGAAAGSRRRAPTTPAVRRRGGARPSVSPAHGPTARRRRRSAVRVRCRSQPVRPSSPGMPPRPGASRSGRACRAGRRWVPPRRRPVVPHRGHRAARRDSSPRPPPAPPPGAAADHPHHHARRGHDGQGPRRPARSARQGRLEGAARPPLDDDHQLGDRSRHRARRRPDVRRRDRDAQLRAGNHRRTDKTADPRTS